MCDLFVLEVVLWPAIWDGWWSESSSERKRRATSICPGWGRRRWMSSGPAPGAEQMQKGWGCRLTLLSSRDRSSLTHRCQKPWWFPSAPPGSEQRWCPPAERWPGLAPRPPPPVRWSSGSRWSTQDPVRGRRSFDGCVFKEILRRYVFKLYSSPWTWEHTACPR